MANKIKVEICLGTTCYVLGSFRLSALEEQLPPELKDRVEVVGCACLDVCHDRNYGNAPFVRINDDRIVDNATIEKVIDILRDDYLPGGNE
ncbi:(2Fe-2S) ferredoxin domain-containing protein [uncultured Victivallis sp.]|uniref:(2Fe-2S) ferredoxin domain-containing protein n=1 Tax=uncultured Victivallis sp. TaxID=354118 RepID=UPI0025E497E9|nr:(2Fe-2S) ferredoxin domain-containing protein [uncultured Victivallis sp.]